MTNNSGRLTCLAHWPSDDLRGRSVGEMASMSNVGGGLVEDSGWMGSVEVLCTYIHPREGLMDFLG